MGPIAVDQIDDWLEDDVLARLVGLHSADLSLDLFKLVFLHFRLGFSDDAGALRLACTLPEGGSCIILVEMVRVMDIGG